MTAKGIHLDENFKLGKGEAKEDEKTLRLAPFVSTDIQIPVSFDFDRYRAKFPMRYWGNDQYGDCVFAAQGNAMLRMERAETKRTIKLTDDDVVSRYKALTGCVTPDDANDQGYVMLDGLNQWRHNPWKVSAQPGKPYTISAFGQVNPDDHWLMRAGIYLFNGIQLGFWLPRSAQSQTGQGYWDVVSGPGSEPGSWGGHAVFAKRFDADNIYVVTWGREVRVSNAFLDKYCDEAWAVIDNLDSWRHAKNAFDVDAMIDKMRKLGITVQV